MEFKSSLKDRRVAMSQKRGLYHFVVSDIADEILAGNVKSGEKLPTEHQLCELYDVSRTVIRDALRVLTNKGLIEARPRSGTVVKSIEHWNFLDPELIVWAQGLGNRTGFFEVLLEARNSVEPQIAALAAQKATEEDIAQIEKSYNEMYQAAYKEIPDIDGYNTADIEFHLALLEATHNIILKQFGALILAALKASFELATETEIISEKSLLCHGDVLDAIKNKDPVKASESTDIIANILHMRVRAATKITGEVK